MLQEYATEPRTQEPRDRWAEVAALEELWAENCVSRLDLAKTLGIPESTLRYWDERARSTDAPAEVVAFFESPSGLWVLHQIVMAARFVLTQTVGGGVRPLCSFLALSGLSRFAASGYGTQCDAVKSLEEAIVEFGVGEKSRLAGKMLPKEITVAQDETFHKGRTCLVAIEPVSNFILVEEYAEDRRAETWDESMREQLDGLPVSIIQSTSDEGSSLLKHVRESLGVHHSPDLFHPQQDISRATSLPLQRQADAAEHAAAEAERRVEELMDEAEAYEAQWQGSGGPCDYEKRIEDAYERFESASVAVSEAKKRREQVRQEARGLSASYHPFDLQRATKRDAAQVEADLGGHLDRIEAVADEAGLSGKSRKRLKKVRRLLPKMVATIAFVHTLMRAKIEALDLASHIEQVVANELVPALYLDEVARKAAKADERANLRQTAAALHDQLAAPNCCLVRLDAETREAVEHVALECAQLFQRSSSCVEGRNGVLALRHHSLHRLSPRKLATLTVLHNFAVTRADGTTAAKRFFGQPHCNLFEHLLNGLPPPPRPAAERRTLH